MADNLLDKASILLTPTAYNDGRMLSVKPEVAFGEELSTNGDFSNGTTGWSNGSSTLSVVDGKLKILATGAFSYARQNITVVSGKKYKITVNFFYNSLVGNIEVYDGTTNTISEQLSEDGVITLSITPSSTNLRLTLLNRNGVSGDFNYWDNVSVKEDLSGDFTFSRSSAATRVNAQGLVENVQIISSELVSNGNFSQIGTEEVSNGNFSQEGSELVTNGDFSNGLTNWYVDDGTSWTNVNNTAFCDGNNGLIAQNIVSTQNKVYKVTFDSVATNSSGKELGVRIDGGTYSWNLYPTGTHTIYLTAGSNSIEGILFYALNGWTGSIDNVSVKEVGQDWDFINDVTVGNGVATFLDSGSNLNSRITQNNILTSGKVYKLTFEITRYVAGSVQVLIGGGTILDVNILSGVGTYTIYGISDGTNLSIKRNGGYSNYNFDITNISVKEVGQDWTILSPWIVGDNVLSIDGSQVSNQYTSQVVSSLTSGSKYKLQYTVSNITAGQFRINVANTLGTYVSSNGTYEFVFNATSGTTLQLQASTTLAASVSNISLKEITDDTDLPRINYEGFSYQDTLGSEEVVNGDFATDSNWSTPSGWEIIDGKLKGTNLSGVSATQVRDIFSNKSFKVVYTVSDYVQGDIRIYLGGVQSTPIRSADGTYTEYIDIISGNSSVYIQGINNFTGSIDNVSVKEVLGQEVVPDSGCGSWLLEPQSTNLVTYSEDFSDASWVKGIEVIITPNQGISPDGLNNAFKYVGSSIGQNFGTTINVSNNYTYSIYVKAINSPFIRLRTSDGSCWFNMTTNAVATNNFASAEIKSVGNDWYRISVTSSSFTASNTFYVHPHATDNTTDELDGAEFLLWGAQVEQQSYATSYIPTNGATNTRLQDIANNSGNSTLINSTEGVLYAEIAALSSPVDSPKNITISDGTVNNYVRIEYYQDGRVYGNVYDGTSVAANFVVNQLNFNKVAIQYSSSGSKLYVNGTGVDFASKIFTSNTLNTIQFSSAAADSNYFYGKNKALAVYKEALTDANLRSLTYPNPVATTFDLDFDTIAEQFTFTRGSEATFVNAQGLIESTASNDAPRIDYSTGAKAFLLEPQSTNTFLHSEDISNSVWTTLGSGETIVSNSVISPDGSLNADTLQGNGSTTNVYVRQDVSLSASVNYTFSIFAKKGTNDFLAISAEGFSGATNTLLIFDLNNSIVTNGTGNIKDYGNGWLRCSFTTAISTDGSGRFLIYPAYNGTTRGFPTSSAANGKNIYLYGAMLEQQSYATSYIPTSGASATRNQELCINATPVINSEEGTLYLDASALTNGGVDRNISLNDNTSSNHVQLILHATDNRIVFRVNSGGVAQANISDYTFEQTDNLKIACVYKQNNFSLWINGIERATDFSGNIPIGLSKLDFSLFNGTQPFFGNIKGLKYYPKALADVQLEDLTS